MASQSSGGGQTEQALDAIREEAAQWIVCLDQAGPQERERLHAECQSWQAQDPRRHRVLAQMRQMWAAVDPTQRRRRNRRRAGVLGILLLAALGVGQFPWNYWMADHRTAAGEIRSLALPDGSEVVLNSASAIEVDYGDRRRTVRLERGEVMVTVRQDPAGRPFSVSGPDGSAIALGTRYSVRLNDGYTVVAVQQSAVRVIPRRAQDNAVTLIAGRRARLTATEVVDLEETDRRAPDWVDRRLVFNDVPLADVLERLARYRLGLLAMRDEVSRRDLRFTGVLPADDSDAALALLADALALQVRRVTPYVVWLENRD